MAKIRLRKFDGGLWLSSPAEEAPEGTMRRNRNLHPLANRSMRQRKGSSLIHSRANVYGITKFTDVWFESTSAGTFFRDDIQIKSGLDTVSFPSIVKMPPRAGLGNYLFVCGLGESFKVDRSDLQLVNDEVYKWTVSGSGTDEYYCELLGGGDPSLNEPVSVQEDDSAMTAGTVGSLAVEEWDWGDNDTLGYDTVYVRLSDGADPDTKDNGYITCTYETNWGIAAPLTTANTNVPGAGGGSGDDLVKLLLHCNGADASTTFTDDSQSGHTVTANGDAQLDTAQKKFGTASGLFDGTGDYLTVPDHTDFTFTRGVWTIDFWLRPSTNTTTSRPIYSQGYASGVGAFTIGTLVGATGYGIYLLVKENDTNYCQINTPVNLIPINTWTHVEVAENGNNYYIFIDGVLKANIISSVENGEVKVSSTSKIRPLNYPSDIHIGWSYLGTGAYWLGWIDEFRISNGICRHDADFTVPASEYEVAGGGANPLGDLDAGTYYYRFTYKNSTTGNRSNPSTEVKAVVAATDLGYVELSEIPTSTDAQVDRVEIWRTIADGSAYFYLTEIANGTTSYADMSNDDILTSDELPTDNLEPFDWFDDCIYHNASAFWITRSEEGEKGRIYYSPIGRCESIEGFINVTDDDDGLQRLVYYAGGIGVFSYSRFFQILGTNPYTVREISGIIGTQFPHSVVTTPLGIMYGTTEGIRLVIGIQSRLVGKEAVERIFDAETVENLSSFTPVYAIFARNEYIISSTLYTLAYNIERNTWRDLTYSTAGFTAYYYDYPSDTLAVAWTNKVFNWESSALLYEDDSVDISIEFEPRHILLNTEKDIIVQYIHIDADTGDETLTVTLVHDDTTTELGTLRNTERTITTYPVGKPCRVVGVRITGDIDAAIEIFGIDIEIPDTAQARE